MQFVGYTRQNFVETTLRYTIPALVLSRDRAALELVAAIVKKGLGVILLDNTSHILSKVFLHPHNTSTSLTFLINLLRNLMRGQPNMDLSAASLMTTCIVPFVVSLVVELGDEDQALADNAKTALVEAQHEQTSGTAPDLGSFLKPHMLGVISQLNEMLHDIQGKKTVIYKRKIIRSLGMLIGLVGDSLSSFSPQVCDPSISVANILRLWLVFRVLLGSASSAKKHSILGHCSCGH